jgi:hypothetical protein
MTHYLIVFDRPRGQILELRQFSDRQDAVRARFEEERRREDQSDVEIVILGAESREALERTHARYFKDLSQLIRSARK